MRPPPSPHLPSLECSQSSFSPMLTADTRCVYVLCMPIRKSARLKHRSGREGRAKAILDRPRLAGLIQAVVDLRFSGNQSETARSVGLHPSQINRLVKQEAPALREATLDALERLLPRRSHRALQDALLNEEVEQVLNTGSQWRDWARNARHLGRRTSLHPFESPAVLQAREASRKLRFSALRWTWEDEYPAPCNALASEAAKYHQSESRLLWAWERMLEPLVDAEDTAFLERAWDELSARERRGFVEASVARERVLLRRDPDLQRAKKVIEPLWRKQLGLGSLWPDSEPAVDEE